MGDEEFQLGSGNWSTQLSKNSRCSSSSPPPPSSTYAAWPVQVVDVAKQPNLQYMMGLGLSSQPVEWNQPSLFRSGTEKSDESCSFRSILHEDNEHSSSSTRSFQQAAAADSEGVFSSLNPSQFISSTHHQPGLLGYEISHQPPQQHSTPSMSNFSSYPRSYGMNLDHQLEHLMLQPNSWQASNNKPRNQLHLSNNAPFWNASPAAPIINHDVRSNLFHSSTTDEKPKKSRSSETSNKRPRNEAASPLPAKKMGDRITALQQLVSPFGKTDTASVLSEAIEYIKFLHEQVSVLSNAYVKSTGAPIQQQKCEKSSDQEGQQQDLRSRGLCLVPVSSSFPVTHETTVDFWNPTFGGSFR